MIRLFLAISISLVSLAAAKAEGVVSAITSAPIYPNGIVRDLRSGINIHLQSEQVRGIDFMNPAVAGYGLEAGGTLEIEMVSGFQRDPDIPLDDRTILLVAGAPQQGLPAAPFGLKVSEGDNPYTYVIRSKNGAAVPASELISLAPGARRDPIPQRGIKIIHIGRLKAFVSRGEFGVIEVRFKDVSGIVIRSGRGIVKFQEKPRPEVFPTNIPHDQRNHNWQRVPTSSVVGSGNNSLPIPLLLYAKNAGFDRDGLEGVGVISRQQVVKSGASLNKWTERFDAGLLLQDMDGNGVLELGKDEIIGGVRETLPDGAEGSQVVTPLVKDRPFLSRSTSNYNNRAAETVGGSIMQVVYVVGDKPGLYRLEFVLLEKPGSFASSDGSRFTYTIVAEDR